MTDIMARRTDALREMLILTRYQAFGNTRVIP